MTNEIAAATNAVLRSALGADITTNDVCAIVTNEVGGTFSEWTWTSPGYVFANSWADLPGSDDGNKYFTMDQDLEYQPGTGGWMIRVTFWEWDPNPDSPYANEWGPLGADMVAYGTEDATSLTFSGMYAPDTVTATRTYTPGKNALGLARLTDLSGLPYYVAQTDGTASNLTADRLTVGSRVAGARGADSATFGGNNLATGLRAFVVGQGGTASNAYSFVYNGYGSGRYGSHGNGTFNVNPREGVYGFWIGGQTLAEAVAAVLSQTSVMNVPYYDDDGNCIGTNTIPPCASEEVRRAVNLAADYLWDPVDEVCYRRQMSGGFLDYVAVTNIDVTLPENWQALEALEAERRSQQ